MERHPILENIIEQYGNWSLYEYAQHFLQSAKIPFFTERKQELTAVARELLTERLGPAIGADVADQLLQLPFVSTADHHATINHTHWINANILSAIAYAGSTAERLRHLVVFSFSSVSLNNISGYARGVEFHSGRDCTDPFTRLPIFPDKEKMGTVYNMRPFSREDIARAAESLEKKVREGLVNGERAGQIRNILQTVYASPQVLSAPSLAAQITAINYDLWPRLFHTAVSSSPDSSTPSNTRVPNLIYLDIETLVTELLLRHHLRSNGSPISSLLLDPAWRESALRHFNNVGGGFSHENNGGTFFFWGLDAQARRVRLTLEGDALRSADGQVHIPFTPEHLSAALREKRMFPGALLCYIVVTLHYGMKCLGAHCQISDLTKTKAAWQTVLRERGLVEEALALEDIPSQELGGYDTILASFVTPEGKTVLPSGIDMLLQNADTSYEHFVEMSKRKTVLESFLPRLPEIYRDFFTTTERDPIILSVTEEDMLVSMQSEPTVRESQPRLSLLRPVCLSPLAA